MFLRVVAVVHGYWIRANQPATGERVNTRVNFADGSFCDPVTGDMQTRGSTRINVRTTGGTHTITMSDGFVKATALRVHAVAGNLTVRRTGPADYMSYSITGPFNQVTAIGAQIQRGVLVISSKGRLKRLFRTPGVHIAGNVNIVVTVSAGTSVVVTELTGDFQIR